VAGEHEGDMLSGEEARRLMGLTTYARGDEGLDRELEGFIFLRGVKMAAPAMVSRRHLS
jgi:hypothetical protein